MACGQRKPQGMRTRVIRVETSVALVPTGGLLSCFRPQNKAETSVLTGTVMREFSTNLTAAHARRAFQETLQEVHRERARTGETAVPVTPAAMPVTPAAVPVTPAAVPVAPAARAASAVAASAAPAAIAPAVVAPAAAPSAAAPAVATSASGMAAGSAAAGRLEAGGVEAGGSARVTVAAPAAAEGEGDVEEELRFDELLSFLVRLAHIKYGSVSVSKKPRSPAGYSL